MDGMIASNQCNPALNRFTNIYVLDGINRLIHNRPYHLYSQWVCKSLSRIVIVAKIFVQAININKSDIDVTAYYFLVIQLKNAINQRHIKWFNKLISSEYSVVFFHLENIFHVCYFELCQNELQRRFYELSITDVKVQSGDRMLRY